MAPFRCSLAALLASFPLVAQTRVHLLGEHGGRVELPEAWRRAKVDPDGGDDQFQVDAGLFALPTYTQVVELRAHLENDEDLRRALDENTGLGQDAKIEFTRDEHRRRAARSTTSRVDGTDVAFRFEVVAGDGLAYVILAWSTKRNHARLATRVAEFRDALVFPAPDSALGKAMAPRRVPFVVGDVESSFDVRPGLLQRGEQTDPQRLGDFSSPNGEQSLLVWAVRDWETAEAFFAADRETLIRWDATYREVERGDSTIGDLPGRWVVGARDTGSVKTLVLPLAERHWFVLRYLAPGGPHESRPAREQLFASVRRRAIEPALALPAPGPLPPGNERAKLAPLLASARELALLGEQWPMAAQRVGDGWLVRTWRNVLDVRGGSARLVLATEQALRFATQWRGDVLVGLAEDAVHTVRDGGVGDAMFHAQHACAVGDDLLLVRASRPPVLGITSTPRLALLRRAPDGSERVVAALDAGSTMSLTAGAGGDRAAVDFAPAQDFSNPRLLEVSLSSGEVRALGEWREIACVAAAPEGWVVTGRPRDEPYGVWHVSGPDLREPWFTGHDLRGLGATQQHLVAARGARLLEIPLEACRAHGSRCQPFARRHLEAIAQRIVRDASPPRTAAELAVLRARLDDLARETTNAPLPATPAEVDELLSAFVRWNEPLTADARVVLGVLVASAAIGAGAQWVEVPADGPREWTGWHVRVGAARRTPFGVGLHVGALVADSLDDSEGGAPMGSELAAVDGRLLLVGTDAGAVAARADAATPAALTAALAAGDVATLRDVLGASAGNVAARRHVYERLVDAGRFDTLLALANEWAQRPQPASIDVVARAAARSESAMAPAAAREWFAETLRAVEQAPRDTALYVWLGRAALRAFPDEPRKARACFARVLELETWGDAVTAAKAELERLPR